MSINCDICHTPIYEFRGAVCVNFCSYYLSGPVSIIPHLRIICSACPDDQRYHAMWPLAWLRDHPGHILDSVLTDLNGSRYRWGEPALLKLIYLFELIHFDSISGALSPANEPTIETLRVLAEKLHECDISPLRNTMPAIPSINVI